jgi:tritrans,polycis-undecaprenyl-diphosphate synthase [geranylgeranyl-diphosphate specific]
VLSLENFEKRPKRELRYLFDLARKEINSILDDKSHIVHRNKVKVNFFGKLEVLPDDLQEGIKRVSEATEKYSDYFLNVAIAYGGRQEIIDASQRIARDVKRGILNPSRINESVLRSYFWTNGFSDPDMIIRTGGERRLSNFLPFQSTYSELIFLDTFWPEMTRDEFSRAVNDYRDRQRRFGK